jgi:hypothetical protein
VFFSLNLFVLLVSPPLLVGVLSLSFILAVNLPVGNCGQRHSSYAALSQRLQFQPLSDKSTRQHSGTASVVARSLLKLVQIVGLLLLEHSMTVIC